MSLLEQRKWKRKALAGLDPFCSILRHLRARLLVFRLFVLLLVVVALKVRVGVMILGFVTSY